MIKRYITVFDNKTDLLIKEIDIPADLGIFKEKYKKELNTDPLLYYEYEMKKEIEFYKNIMDIDFEFDKYTYFLSCSEVK